jgi:tRNA(Ile)-lysidine synthase
MAIRTSFEQAMRSFGIAPGSAPVFLAISGGVDSIALAHLLKESGYSPTWLHVNFQLRGEESERDQQFVEALARSWNQSIHVNRLDAASYAEQHKCSIQEAARTLRYDWFAQVVRAAGKQAVLLTAHQSDDNAETLLMNLLRGTGLRGLTGIPPINDYIRRPLLRVSRTDINQYVIEHGLTFVEDSSNQSTDYTRNQLRLEVLPLLRKIYPQVDRNLLQNIERFGSAYSIYQNTAKQWMRKYIQTDKEGQRVSVALLLESENRAMIHEWLSPYGFTEKQEFELIRMGESESGRWIDSADGTHRIVKHRKHFILSSIPSVQAADQWIEAGQSKMMFVGGQLSIDELKGLPKELDAGAQVALVDATALSFPLLLRPWRAGDYFYPLGLNKKKKIARFLIDQKLSKVEKEKVWVIESAGRIVWVVGQRIDHRFRISESSRSVLKIDLSGQ